MSVKLGTVTIPNIAVHSDGGTSSLSNICYMEWEEFANNVHVPIDLTNLSNFICMIYIEDEEGHIWTGGTITNDGESSIDVEDETAFIKPQGYDWYSDSYTYFMGIDVEFGDDSIWVTGYDDNIEYIVSLYAVFIAI